MAFSALLHIHTLKRKNIHQKAVKLPIFPQKTALRGAFQPKLRYLFRLVAQNFRIFQKMANLLPFMSKNGIFSRKILDFWVCKRFFLCKTDKNTPVLSIFSVTAVTKNRAGEDKPLRGQKPSFFVHSAQKQPPSVWLTAPTCLSIIGQVPDLNPN